MGTLHTRPRAADELRDTPIGLAGDTRRAVIAALAPVLADHLALHLLYKAHHWSVDGPHFRELHLLFDDHARAVLAAPDDVAERIAQLGGQASATPTAIAAATGVREAPAAALAPQEMLEALIHAGEGVIGRVRRAIAVADDDADPVTSDLLTGGVLRSREKEAWILHAHLRRD